MTQTLPTTDDDKVADALRHSWVYHLPKWVWPYAQLARWERPIGWQLLMWPCWWSVLLGVIASELSVTSTIVSIENFSPSRVSFNFQKLIPLFLTVLVPLFLGAFVMRGAGCTYNDLADVDIDNQVERTRSRPLPSGRTTRKQAFAFLILQGLAGLCVLLFLSRYSSFVFWLGTASLLLVAIYPFMKRITWWPQLFLGLAFSWGALMGWAIIWREISIAPLLLYIGSIFWVIGYDTIYAHQDREDDALVGVKSTARLFGKKSKFAITILYSLAMSFFAAAFWMAAPFTQGMWIWSAWLGLTIGAVHMIWQIAKLDIDDGGACLRLFKSNSTFGLTLFLGLAGALLLA
ncbi:MAG: 4-hydroxybenzoate octaprenyltransferase [Pseudomonadota bacterium]